MLTHNIRSLHSIKFLHTLRSVKSCQFSGFLPSISPPPVAEEWPNIYLQYLFKYLPCIFSSERAVIGKSTLLKAKFLSGRHIKIKSRKIYEDRQGHTWGNRSCWEAVGLIYGWMDGCALRFMGLTYRNWNIHKKNYRYMHIMYSLPVKKKLFSIH